MRRLIILVALALVASLILVNAAAAQEETVMEKIETPTEGVTVEEAGPPPAVEAEAQKAEQQAEQPKMMEQPKMVEETKMMEKTQPLPQSGGLGVGSVLLPAAALLLGSGVLAYTVLRRR